MLIVGEWLVGDDGIARPVLRGKVLAADGTYVIERFLIDTGADQTAVSSVLCSRLQLQALPTPTGIGLRGIGGSEPFVVILTTVEFTRMDGGPAHIRGEFPAFTDVAATSISIFGNDVLRHFDVITSQRRNEVLLVSGRHRYEVALD